MLAAAMKEEDDGSRSSQRFTSLRTSIMSCHPSAFPLPLVCGAARSSLAGWHLQQGISTILNLQICGHLRRPASLVQLKSVTHAHSGQALR